MNITSFIPATGVLTVQLDIRPEVPDLDQRMSAENGLLRVAVAEDHRRVRFGVHVHRRYIHQCDGGQRDRRRVRRDAVAQHQTANRPDVRAVAVPSGPQRLENRLCLGHVQLL